MVSYKTIIYMRGTFYKLLHICVTLSIFIRYSQKPKAITTITTIYIIHIWISRDRSRTSDLAIRASCVCTPYQALISPHYRAVYLTQIEIMNFYALCDDYITNVTAKMR